MVYSARLVKLRRLGPAPGAFAPALCGCVLTLLNQGNNLPHTRRASMQRESQSLSACDVLSRADPRCDCSLPDSELESLVSVSVHDVSEWTMGQMSTGCGTARRGGGIEGGVRSGPPHTASRTALTPGCASGLHSAQIRSTPITRAHDNSRGDLARPGSHGEMRQP